MLEDQQHTETPLFLATPDRSIRYADLPGLVKITSTHLLQATTSQPMLAGINTSNRFSAVLWMITCWIHRIPFVPFHDEFTEPLEAYTPTHILERDIAEMSAFLAANVSSVASMQEVNAALCRFQSRGLCHNKEKPPYPAIGLLTSGSTGRPKRVPITRQQVTSAARNAWVDVPHADLNHLVWGNCLPLYHAGGLSILFRSFLNRKGMFLWDSFSPSVMMKSLQGDSGITDLSLVPTMMHRLLEFSEQHRVSPPASLRRVLLGGSPASTTLIQKAKKQRWPVAMSFGMTETFGQVISSGICPDIPDGSSGKPLPGVRINVLDSSGNEVPAGVSGRLHVSSEQLFSGYLSDGQSLHAFPGSDEFPVYPNPLGTPANTTRDGQSHQPGYIDNNGWFDTGDYAKIDLSGWVYIDHRKNDIIITGGKKVHIPTLEEKIQEIDDIQEVAVTSIQDEEWGELVIAVIVPVATKHSKDTFPDEAETTMRGMTIPEESFLSYLKEKLLPRCAPWEIPKKVFFISSLPTSPLGKIQRPEIQNYVRGRLA